MAIRRKLARQLLEAKPEKPWGAMAAAYLALWIKNARAMKPEAIMPTLGMDEYDPILKAKVTSATGGLTDQQIADIVAYLTVLK